MPQDRTIKEGQIPIAPKSKNKNLPPTTALLKVGLNAFVSRLLPIRNWLTER